MSCNVANWTFQAAATLSNGPMQEGGGPAVLQTSNIVLSEEFERELSLMADP
jgi:hypothetical protein